MTSTLDGWAQRWAQVALANVVREFPWHGLIGIRDADDLPGRPRERHPAFYGSLDWHSCVEMHWVLARLLRLAPGEIPAEDVRRRLDAHLTADTLAVEAANVPPSERPYGYAWTLMLADELARLAASGDTDAARWSDALSPLTERVAAELTRWWPRATYPVRVGMHSNSAFAMSLSLRYARQHDDQLARVVSDTARRWYAGDVDYPGRYEPSGTDFLSPCLTEAELMSQVLAPDEFDAWFAAYLPALADGEPAALLSPAVVSDPSDGQVAHLHGLNLSRAWCWRRLAAQLPDTDPRWAVTAHAVGTHTAASIDATVGSDYMVEHWLVAYALLLETDDEAGPGTAHPG